MALREYKPGTTFPGVIGRTPDVSKPAWPAPNRAKEGAPNVLFLVLDDTGFGHLGCYRHVGISDTMETGKEL
jgi:arylsulfatase